MSTPLEHPKDTDDHPFALPTPSKGAPKTQPPRRIAIEPEDDYKRDAPPGFDTEPKSPMGQPTRTRPVPMRKASHKPG